MQQDTQFQMLLNTFYTYWGTVRPVGANSSCTPGFLFGLFWSGDIIMLSRVWIWVYSWCLRSLVSSRFCCLFLLFMVTYSCFLIFVFVLLCILLTSLFIFFWFKLFCWIAYVNFVTFYLRLVRLLIKYTQDLCIRVLTILLSCDAGVSVC